MLKSPVISVDTFGVTISTIFFYQLTRISFTGSVHVYDINVVGAEFSYLHVGCYVVLFVAENTRFIVGCYTFSISN